MTTFAPQADAEEQGPNCAIAVSIRFGGTCAVDRRVQSACASATSLVSIVAPATARPAPMSRDAPHFDRVMCLLLPPAALWRRSLTSVSPRVKRLNAMSLVAD